MVENSLTGIYIDQDEKIVFAKNRFAEIFRYPRQELINMEPWRLVHPEDRDLSREMRTRGLKGEDALKFMGATKDPRIEMGYEDRGDFHQFYVRDNASGLIRNTI